MSQSACIESGWYLSKAFEDPRVQERVRALRAANAEAEEIVETLASFAPEGVAENLRLEFRELPSITLTCIIDAWAMADRAGRRFSVESVRPEKPLAFARNRRVRVAIEADEDAVRVVLSHVASRHASWYQVGAAHSA